MTNTYFLLGVGIFADAQRLWRDWKIVVNGWIDLQNVCSDLERHKQLFDFKRFGLKNLALSLFGDIPRFVKWLPFSDWTRRRLDQRQLFYASWDAQIGVDIFCAAAMSRHVLGT